MHLIDILNKTKYNLLCYKILLLILKIVIFNKKYWRKH